MRIKSLGPGVVSLGAAKKQAVPAISPSKHQPLDKSLSKLVERRVRASLTLVKRGEATAAQALQAVVWHLAQELPEPAFASLLTYFQAKQAQGALAPAKQLLLRCLRAAQQGICHNPAPARAPQPARKQPLRDQQQPPAQQALQAAAQQANKAAGAFQALRPASSFNNLTTVTGSKVAGPLQLLSPPDQAANSGLQQADAPRTKQQQQQPAVAVLGCSSKAASWFSSHNCQLQLDV